MSKKIEDCSWFPHTDVLVIYIEGRHCVGRITGQMREVKFIKENSLIHPTHRDVRVGDIVQIATMHCPHSFLSFLTSKVVINNIEYNDGEKFMRQKY